MNTDEICTVTDTIALEHIVNMAVRDAGASLESSDSYLESAERLAHYAPSLAELLRAAEKRWVELESS